MTAFPTLFSPLRVGPITVRNRIANLPQGMGYTNRGQVEDEDIAYHRRRAAGGAALIITGGTATHPSSQSRSRTFVEAWDPAILPGLRRRSEAIHAEGAHVVGQLFNLGRYMAAEDMMAVPLAPSALRAPGLTHRPMAMGTDDIAEVVEGFVASARNFIDGGNDGVEIHAAHGYLLAQFLSPASNRRDDAYGGDLAGRARLLIEIARGVRAEIGDRVLGVRLSADDEAPGGTTPEDCRATIGLLRSEVGLDYVSLAVGLKGTYVKDSSAPEGVSTGVMATVARGLDLPVIVSQRIRTPEAAELALAATGADMVGLARALIADPEWVVKAQRGDRERIRLCVGDVQDCRSHLAGGLRCMVNPDVGSEIAVAAPDDRGGRRRRIAVVGAGPAGLEFARRAAESGHQVSVHDQNARPGGQLLLAARAPGREELLDLVRFQLEELRRLDVALHTGQRVADVTTLDADLVVVATGATTGRVPDLGLAGADSLTKMTTGDLIGMDGGRPLGHVVVLDDGTGGWSAVTAALAASERATSVTIVTAGGSVVARIPSEAAAGVRAALRRRGVRWMVDANPVEVVDGELQLAIAGAGDTRALPVDTLVVEVERAADDGLWRTARDRGRPVAAIGDARSPRTVGNAVRDARQLEASLTRGDLQAWGPGARDLSRGEHVER